MIAQKKEAQAVCWRLCHMRQSLTALPRVILPESVAMKRELNQTVREMRRLLGGVESILCAKYPDDELLKNAETIPVRKDFGGFARPMSLRKCYASTCASLLADYEEPQSPDLLQVVFESAVLASQASSGKPLKAGTLRLQNDADAILCLTTLYAARFELIYLCGTIKFQSLTARIHFCNMVGEVLLLILYGILVPLYRQYPALMPLVFRPFMDAKDSKSPSDSLRRK